MRRLKERSQEAKKMRRAEGKEAERLRLSVKGGKRPVGGGKARSEKPKGLMGLNILIR